MTEKLVSFKDLMSAKKDRDRVENAGQPVSQNSASQSTSVVSQLDGQLASQLDGQLANQSANEKIYRSRKERRQKGLRLPVQKLEKWELWCFLNKIEFQEAIEIAMDWLTSQPANHILNDDYDDNKETDEIIIFYRKWTGNNIRPKDRIAREEVKRFSEDVCKIGILTAISRAKTKINSFAYCVPVIEDIAEEVSVLDGKGEYLLHLEKFILSARKGK
jgi:hypothetical protein